MEDTRKYKCNLCGKSFRTRQNLAQHATSHADERPYKCKICPKAFKQQAHLNAHMQSHGDKLKKSFICGYCKEGFTTYKYLGMHIRVHTGEKPYKCNFCEEAYTQSTGLRRHLRNHTGEQPKLFSCDICETTFGRKYDVDVHRRTHTGEKPYNCSLCDKRFTQIPGLRAHLKTHTKEKPYKCTICQKEFLTHYYLKEHGSRVHPKKKPFQCDTCSKTFSLPCLLFQHKKNHTAVKSHVCDQCSKAFINKHKLERHIKFHTGEKPHKCPMCKKKFAHRYEIKKHLIVHTQEKPHKCPFCIKEFAYRYEINRHLMVHTRVNKSCFKPLSTPESVDKHLISVNRGARRFKCTGCQNTYTSQANLKIHLKEHTGEQLCQRKARLTHNKLPRGHNNAHLKEKTIIRKTCAESTTMTIGLNNFGKLHNKAVTTVNPKDCKTSEITLQKFGYSRKDANLHDRGKITNKISQPDSLGYSYSQRISPCKQCNIACESLENMCTHYSLCHNLPVVHLKEMTFLPDIYC